MKYLLKSSFALILLMAVFNIGVTNAYAVEKKASDTNKIEKVDAVPLQCHTNSVANAAMLFSGVMATNIMDNCRPGAIVLENGTVILIFPDCTIVIDDQDGDDPVVIEA